jgi:hypothetical protein
MKMERDPLLEEWSLSLRLFSADGCDAQSTSPERVMKSRRGGDGWQLRGHSCLPPASSTVPEFLTYVLPLLP